MAPKKAPVEDTEFRVTLAEFLGEIQKPETRKAFELLMKKEGQSGHKLPREWRTLLDLFCRKPVGVSWAEWSKPTT